jgi:hypothetical protein
VALTGRLTGRRIDCFLQFLGGAEGDALACLDLDRFARRRVAAHAGGALAHHENAESAEADALPALQMFHDQTDRVAEDGFGLLLCDLVIFRDLRGNMFQRDGGWGLSRLFSGHVRCSPFGLWLGPTTVGLTQS